MNITVRAEKQALWLCFEPWATEYTLLPGAAVVVRFGEGVSAEVTHHNDGMTFFNIGPHPDLYAEDGTALEIYSEYLPATPPELSAELYRAMLELMPPIRSEPDRLN
jgi:hypothetical protein